MPLTQQQLGHRLLKAADILRGKMLTGSVRVIPLLKSSRQATAQMGT